MSPNHYNIILWKKLTIGADVTSISKYAIVGKKIYYQITKFSYKVHISTYTLMGWVTELYIISSFLIIF